MGGVIHDPSGTEIPRGWGGLIGRTIRGRGMDIFWNHTMPSGKAPGIDKISIQVIKHSLPAILPSVTSIINESFASNTFPIEWKTAEVIPVLKEGDHEKPDNYRPISPLPVLSKTMRAYRFKSTYALLGRERSSLHPSKW